MFDCIVIGGGPAGMAASVYLARQKMHFAMFAGNLGGQVIWSSDVENYLGIHQISGIKLVEAFDKHLEDYREAMELHEGEKVKRVTKTKGGFSVETERGAYPTRTVLIATGADHRKLGVPGEDEYTMKGISYCATCDAPLFANKVVHIVGGGNSAMDAALFAAKYAKEVHLVTINAELMGDEVMKQRCLSQANVQVHVSTKTVGFAGKAMLESIILAGADGKDQEVPTEGVFIEIGLMPQSEMIDFAAKDKSGQFIIDSHNRTNVDGVWAAGDVTSVAFKQIAVAVGEGSKAALDIIRYLQSTQA
jgi:alkyl hydroperoxide reductase subunit F